MVACTIIVISVNMTISVYVLYHTESSSDMSTILLLTPKALLSHMSVTIDGELVYRLKFAVISHNNKSLLAGCVQLISHIWLNVTYPYQIMSMLACSVLNMEQTKTIFINNLSLCILGYQSILSGVINAALLFPQQHVLFYTKHAFGIIHKQHNTIDFILVSTLRVFGLCWWVVVK